MVYWVCRSKGSGVGTRVGVAGRDVSVGRRVGTSSAKVEVADIWASDVKEASAIMSVDTLTGWGAVSIFWQAAMHKISSKKMNVFKCFIVLVLKGATHFVEYYFSTPSTNKVRTQGMISHLQ